MAYTLGIDIGTFESKGVLVDKKGQIIAQAARPHEMIVPRPGWAEHRPAEDWWGDTVFLCHALLGESGIDPGQIRAMAVSAIGPCMLPVDVTGDPLMNGVLYGVDTRAEAEIAELTERIGAEVILARCGNPLTAQSVGPKILWLRRNRPDLYVQTARIHTSTGYIVMKLTGAHVIDHFTAANFSPLYDVTRLDWVFDLADDIAPRALLPELKWSTDIAGQITPQAAAETGLAAGTPVTVGTIDAAAEAASVGVSAPGDMMMMYGSTIFIIQVTDQAVHDQRLYYAPWLYPDTHASMAGLATSGTLTHWFRDQFARELTREEAFAVLAAEAEASRPGANGLLMLPYFSGERSPINDPKAKGSFFGLNLTHTRGDLYRALIEGIAMGTAHVLECSRDAGVQSATAVAVGGGTKNAIWLQATSDFGQIPQIVPQVTFGASYGDAFLAARSIGVANAEDIKAWNPPLHRIEPHHTPLHSTHLERFKGLYRQTMDIAHAL